MSVATVRAPHPVLAAWAALRATGAPRGALVTLVGADGGASKILGTQLALAEDGRAFGSVTIGGCADGRAVTAAKHAVQSGARELLTLLLAEADARALGLGCAGAVELLVEPAALDANDPVVLALEAAAVSLGNGIRAALVTPLAAFDNGIPFYAALPNSTIDSTLTDACGQIEIEERPEMEVRSVIGLQGTMPPEAAPVLVVDHNTPVSNPAFDVTPARLVSGIITEHGVFAPTQLAGAIAITIGAH